MQKIDVEKMGLMENARNVKINIITRILKARKQYDPEFKLLKNIRGRLNKVLKGKSKSQTTQATYRRRL